MATWNLFVKFIFLSLEDKVGDTGLVVSVPDSGSKGPGSSPGQVIVLCCWVRLLALTVPLSTLK